jgi:ATP-binding protein involved in chromosome partitioning
MFGQAQIKVPVIGLVENMSYFTPAELPQNKYYIFGKEGGKRLADEYDIPFLGEIPLIQSIREGGDNGTPAMINEDDGAKQAFVELGGNVARSVSMRNAHMKVEEIAETV